MPMSWGFDNNGSGKKSLHQQSVWDKNKGPKDAWGAFEQARKKKKLKAVKAKKKAASSAAKQEAAAEFEEMMGKLNAQQKSNQEKEKSGPPALSRPGFGGSTNNSIKTQDQNSGPSLARPSFMPK
jgi:hypothetical protein